MQANTVTSSGEGNKSSGSKPSGSNDDGQSGNHHDDSRKKNKKNRNQRGGTSNQFKGKCEELEGAVYDVGSPQSGQDLYNNTTKEIAEYAARAYDEAGEFCLGLIDLNLPILRQPKPPGKEATLADVEIYKMDLKEFRDRSRKRETNMSKIFALILGQCSRAIRDKLEASDKWATINEASDVIGLLKLILQSMYTKATNQHPTVALIEAEIDLHRFCQTEVMSNFEYLEKMKGLIEVYKHLGGEPGCSRERLKHWVDSPSKDLSKSADLAKVKARS